MLPPHITLYSDRLDSRTDAINRLKQVAKVCQPTYLRSVAIEAGPLFTKSLVVRFCNSDKLTHWFNQLRKRSADTLGYSLDPHLSLLYSTEKLQQIQALAMQLPLPSPALFNRLWLVTHPMSITSRSDVASVVPFYGLGLEST